MKKRGYNKPKLEIDYCNDDVLTISNEGDNLGNLHEDWLEEENK